MVHCALAQACVTTVNELKNPHLESGEQHEQLVKFIGVNESTKN